MTFRVPHLDFNKGITVFHGIINQIPDSYNLFIMYLGEVPQYIPSIDTYFMEQRAHDRLQMLLGPHGHTIAKAWLAKQGEARCHG